MNLQTTFYILVILAICLPQVNAVFSYLMKKTLKVNESESFTFRFDSLEIQASPTKRYNSNRPKSGRRMAIYWNATRDYTADERCEKGLPLGMSVLTFSAPYVWDKMNTKFLPARNIIAPNGTVVGKTKPFMLPISYTWYGIFPEILKKAIPTCCHPNASVQFAKLLFTQHIPADVSRSEDYDFTFPLYGDSMEATMYRSNPFIPIIEAPSVALVLMNDNVMKGKTKLIAKTIVKIWPLFLFILLFALCSGIIMWLLDRTKNETQFPRPFIRGALEGFWWAFITMTTVGYGDRTPKSFLARFFCILWILFSVVIMCILCGLITAAFFAYSSESSISFNIHGAKIGAVKDSEEFKFGLSLNAEMLEFKNQNWMFSGMFTFRKIEGMLLDNYIANVFGEPMIANNMRIDRMMDHPITYGIRMAKGSDRLEKCLREYLRDNRQEVFDIFKKFLKPVKNPNDHENLQQQEANKLFHSDETLDDMLLYGAIFTAALVFLGLCRQLIIYFFQKRKEHSEQFMSHVISDVKRKFGRSKEKNIPREMLEQYKCFQDSWFKRMKAIHQE